MRRILFLLVFFVLIFSHPANYPDKSEAPTSIKNNNIVWNNKELYSVIEKVKRANSEREEILIIREHVIITAYTPSVWETDSTPLITASGKRISKDYVAVSRDLLPKFPYGTKVKIFIPDKNLPGCGKEVMGENLIVRQVEDTMNMRYTKTIDLVFFSREKAIKFGKCKGIIASENL
jgi:3D (Asp-Asp-Asp) domain-containing protein